MIIVNIIGGLGNQMFQYACGYALASKYKTTLKIDTTGFRQYTLREYALDRFKIHVSHATEEEVRHLKFQSTSYIKRVYYRLSGKKMEYASTYYKEPGFEYQEIPFNGDEDIYLDGYWQSEKYFSDYRDDLLKMFTLKEKLHEQTEQYQKRIEETEAVSLHIRRGDYVSNPHTNSVHGTCPLEYYENAVKQITERVENPHFYIFSDDLVWAKENITFIKDITFVELDDMIPDHEEMYLMSRCRHNIIANSSFSWWGAWLNKNPQKIVIAPRQWFQVDDFDTRDLLPSDWSTL